MTTARTLDLSKLQSPERLELAKQTLEGFARDGFIKIVGHGMTENELTQILAWV
jgi:isopenicillin N synthase-like dioxygenase